MKTLTIRGVPDEVHEALKERARRNHRSVNQEVIVELAGAGHPDFRENSSEKERKRERARSMVEVVDKWRDRLPGFMTAEEIDAAIEEGRE